jgi:phosphoadenosine phosphosulfate reductase
MAMAEVEILNEKPFYERGLRFVHSGGGEVLGPEEILTWAVKNFHPRIALSCSFGAPEGLVLLDMMHRIEPGSRVFVLFPRAEEVQAMVSEKGHNLFFESVENRQLCCRVRKVEPLNRYLVDLDAWVTGLRRDQNVSRAETPKLEIDAAHGGIVKVNPLADWTHEDVLRYVRAYDVPTNRLHKQGYPSVGCSPCSRAIRPGDDPRAGRWWWESPETKECGIHVQEEDAGSGI